MFPEIQCSEKLEMLLVNIQHALAQNDSVEEIKLSLDKLENYSKNPELCDKKHIDQLINILKDKLVIKACSIVSQDYASLQERYKALLPVHQVLLATDFGNSYYRGVVSALFNRFYGLKVALSSK